jgi:hypothetical protein
MLAALRHRTYRHLFAAQVLSLIGTGLTTVALRQMADRQLPARSGLSETAPGSERCAA